MREREQVPVGSVSCGGWALVFWNKAGRVLRAKWSCNPILRSGAEASQANLLHGAEPGFVIFLFLGFLWVAWFERETRVIPGDRPGSDGRAEA